MTERFWSKVRRTDGCWEWTGYVGRDGYGQTSVAARLFLAHRRAYELVVGPIPGGLTLDHLCRNRSCVRPDHLEPVTSAENTRRGQSPNMRASRLPHCKNRHPYDEANTYLYRGHRRCRTCHRVYQASRYVHGAPEQVRRAHQVSAAARWAKWRRERGIEDAAEPREGDVVRLADVG